MLVGVHGSNKDRWDPWDYIAVKDANVSVLKMMSHTDESVFAQLYRNHPNIEFIVRLYDDRIGSGGPVGVTAFLDKMIPIVRRLMKYTNKFEIHNEPNHVEGIEGWGAERADAEYFKSWYGIVLDTLKDTCSGAKFGFPGLALPGFVHHDLMWLDVCRDEVARSDWLGCHCYWQDSSDMFSTMFGHRFKAYHAKFPDKKIHVTEFGNSTEHVNPVVVAAEYPVYYETLAQYPYIKSASAFILSSHDPAWNNFIWVKAGGEQLPVVRTVGAMPAPKPRFKLSNIVNDLPVHSDPEEPYPERGPDDWTTIVIHHSAVSPFVGAKRFAEYHIAKWGWDGIGYHIVAGLERDKDHPELPMVPIVELTQELTTVSNHAGERYNPRAIGICIRGMYNRIPPSDLLLNAVGEAIQWAKSTTERKRIRVVGHREVSSTFTYCPGDTFLLPKEKGGWKHKVKRAKG